MNSDNYVGAFYDNGEWCEILTVNTHLKLENVESIVKRYSMRSKFLCGIFKEPYQLGSMIFDTPLMLFLHGVKYNREDYGLVELETIIDNAKAGI